MYGQVIIPYWHKICGEGPEKAQPACGMIVDGSACFG
jgi:hypothetical protein